MIPMAISLGYGILFATFITLLLVPCAYMILEDLHSLTRKVFPFQRMAPAPKDKFVTNQR